MDFYGVIIDVTGDSNRPTFTISESGSGRIRRVSIIDVHWIGKVGNSIELLANGNLLTDNDPEIIERFVIVEIHNPNQINENYLSADNCLYKEVFVHSRFHP